MSDNPAETRSRLYGRRKGRPLHKRKTMLMQDVLSKYQIHLSEKSNFDPATCFAKLPAELWLEIGFGGGEHLAAQAAAHPEYGFIGCEPFVNGIASLLDHLDRGQIENVRIFPNDARLLLEALPAASLARCYVLFADPWPKARHAERRFIGPENLPRLARALKPGGELRLATDDPKLSEWMQTQMNQAADFAEIYNARTPPPDWVPTRYEQKAIQAGRVPVYRNYRRRK